MHRISWIFGIGALLLVACAVERSETSPPPQPAAASTTEPATPSSSSGLTSPSTEASCFKTCLDQCDPSDDTCGEACRCLCFGAEYCP